MHMHDVLRSDRPYRYPEGHVVIFLFLILKRENNQAKSETNGEEATALLHLISHLAF
jgi:hypothetical protein